MNFPNIDLIDGENPTISSPTCAYVLQFDQTRESLLDIETYKSFLDNAILRFRHSETYIKYKSFLMELGLDRCQFHGNITSEMADIEMHHNMLTIFDIAIILTEHQLNTVGKITTFDLVELLKQEHKKNRVQLVMLTKTPHQLFHNNPKFFIHPRMCFGNWQEFLRLYHDGITRDIANKLIYYLDRAIREGGSNDNGLLDLRNNIYSWSIQNEGDY